MVILPLLYKEKIYNVKVSLKESSELSKNELYDFSFEGDIIIYNQNYNSSSYNTKEAPLNNIIQFIRANSLYSSDPIFYVVSRKDQVGNIRISQVLFPNQKVTDGLDALYSSVIQNMRRDIPNHSKDRNISLKKLEVAEHVTEPKLKVVRKAMDRREKEGPKNEVVLEMERTLLFLDQFDCSVLSSTAIEEKTMQSMLGTMDNLNTDVAREMKNYYQTAKENGNDYAKLDHLSQILRGESLDWLKVNKDYTKVKTRVDYNGK